MKCDIRQPEKSTLQIYCDKNNGRLPVGAIKDEPKKGIYFDFETMKIKGV